MGLSLKKTTFVLFFIIYSFYSNKHFLVYAESLGWTKAIGIDSYSQEIRVAPSNPNIIYSSLRNNNQSGLYKSTDIGNNFFIVFPLLTGRDVNSIAISHTDPNKVWIGTYEQGIYKTADGGNIWSQSGLTTLRIRFITVDPQNDNILYVGTGQNNSDGGIYKSINGGTSWSQVGTSTYGYKNDLSITVDQSNSNRIFAGSDFNLYRTLDGGINWSALPLTNAWAPAIVIDKSNSNIIYDSANNIGIYKSIDGGNNWNLKNTGMGSQMVFRLAQDDSTALYASVRNGSGGVWRSKDGAETWENVGDPSWGTASTWGLDAKNGRVYVSVEGLGIFAADASASAKKKHPVVFVPGFATSWSYKGIVEHQPTNNSDWKLFPKLTDPYYGPLLSYLETAGLQRDQNLFVFAYDYRKSIADNATIFNTYLTDDVVTKNQDTTIDLIGHSMGGLIIHYCVEKIPGCAEKINKIATGGSPQQGVLTAYKLWEGGKIEETDIFKKLSERAALHLTNLPHLSNKDIIQTNFPGVKDLLPIFDYLSNKPYPTMSSLGKNPILESLYPPNSTFKSVLATFNGNALQTASFYNTVNPNKVEQLLGLWTDGKPISTLTANGDNTVMVTSAQVAGAADNKFYPVSHENIFRDTQILTDILSYLTLTPTSVSIPGLPETDLLFTVHSPVTLQLTDQSGNPIGEVFDNGKSTVVPNPPEIVHVILTGISLGQYQLDSFLSSASTAVETESLIGTINPGEQKTLTFNRGNTLPHGFIIPGGDLFLSSFNFWLDKINSHFLVKMQSRVNALVQKFPGSKTKKELIANLSEEYFQLVGLIATEQNTLNRNNLTEASYALENLITQLNQSSPINLKPQLVNLLLTLAEKEIHEEENANHLSQEQAATILFAQEQLERAKNLRDQGNLFAAWIITRGLFALF